MRGWQSISRTFKIWGDLMTSNYGSYGILMEDDSFKECLSWFWWSLGENTVYSKAFLEYLMEMTNDVDTGKVKTYPIDEVMKNLKIGNK